MKSPSPIEPAALAFAADGVPWSPRYDDIYHSAESGPGQARHVFLGGNQLPDRWRGQRNYTILETGFGLGLNFLVTWQAWLDDPFRCGRLNYVAVEKHPFPVESLAALHARYPELESLAAQLRTAWPMLVSGVHRISLNDGQVLLTLGFGDASAILPRLQVVPNAIFLDGFAPSRNPDMWSAGVLKAVARKALPGTTLSTYTSAAAVRRGLEAEGFACERSPGFGRKREMLCARFEPRWPQRRANAPAGSVPPRHALVIGAGLAGSALCERLASRGWRVELLESARSAATGASGLHAGAFHPHVSPDDCLLSRLARNAFLQGLVRWRNLDAAGQAIEWSTCGVLQLPRHPDEEGAMAQALSGLGYPAAFAEYVDAARAQTLAGTRTGTGGWWFPAGGWLRAATLVKAQLAAADGHLLERYGEKVFALQRNNQEWRALAQDGRVIAAAPVVVLANAADAQSLTDFGVPIRRIRGRLSLFADTSANVPRAVVSGTGYVLPASRGMLVAGSTYETEDAPLLAQADAHAANLTRLRRLLPDFPADFNPQQLNGQQAERAVARDRLPLIGAVPDLVAAGDRQEQLCGAHLADLPRREGLYCATGFGSRGIVWSALAGELLASRLEGEPMPLESDLERAIDPARFALRALRHGHL